MNSAVTEKLQVYTVVLSNTERLCSGPWIKLSITKVVIKGISSASPAGLLLDFFPCNFSQYIKDLSAIHCVAYANLYVSVILLPQCTVIECPL